MGHSCGAFKALMDFQQRGGEQHAKPLSVALGTVFTVSLAHTAITSADENPFSMQPISGGYMMLAEGKCGEGKCGAGKSGEGKCDGSR